MKKKFAVFIVIIANFYISSAYVIFAKKAKSSSRRIARKTDFYHPNNQAAQRVTFTQSKKFEITTKDGQRASFTARRAEKSDLSEIINLYDSMSEDDRGLVITFPEPFRSTFLDDSISNGHIFIVCDATQKIIALVKIFLVKEQALLEHMLRNELRVLPSNILATPVIRDRRFFRVSKDDVVNYSSALEFTPHENDLMFDWHVDNIAVIYCGSCYAREEFRGMGIGSILEAFAFQVIQPSAVGYIQEKKMTKVCLLFGKVAQTYQHQGLLRSFISFIFDTVGTVDRAEKISLLAWAFKANLPVFFVNSEGILMELSKNVNEWTDYGCVFMYDLPLADSFLKKEACFVV